MVEEIEVRFSDGGRARSPPLAAASLRLRPRRLLLCNRGEQPNLLDIPMTSLASSFVVAVDAVLRCRGTPSPARFPATPGCAAMSIV